MKYTLEYNFSEKVVEALKSAGVCGFEILAGKIAVSMDEHLVDSYLHMDECQNISEAFAQLHAFLQKVNGEDSI